jgi:uroporphyrinogen decarboxylase
MNGLERILAAVRFEVPDRVPVMPQVFGHAARAQGIALERYLTDPAILARCQVAAMEDYGSDAVFALLDVNVETEALGSTLNYRKDGYPSVAQFILDRPEAVAGLQLPDPRSAGRMPVALEAARLLRREVGDRVLVAGCVLGPMTLACQLLGAEKALFAAVDEPAAFERILDFSVEVALRFGGAQLEAGAHLCLVFDPSASPAVVPPGFFRELLAKRHRRLSEGLRRQGACATWLHIAGPTEAILPLYHACGVDIANVDYCVDPGALRARLPGLALEGNIRSLAFMDSEPPALAEACARLLDLPLAKGFILSSGCEIPLEATPGCIRTLAAASRAQAGRA